MRAVFRVAGAAALLALPAAARPAASPGVRTGASHAAPMVLAHAVARGDLLTAADFEPADPAAPLATGALSPSAASGREAVRPLPAGVAVRATDLVAPRLVRRGEPVTIALRSGPLLIATGGRALASGGMGEPVRVVTTSTSRTLDGVVEGPGAVRVANPGGTER